MSDIEHSGEYDNEISNLHQDQPKQGTLSGGGPIRQTRAKPRKGKSILFGKDSEYFNTR